MAASFVDAEQRVRPGATPATHIIQDYQPGPPSLTVLLAALRSCAGPLPMSNTAGWAMPGVALKRMRGSAAGRCRGASRSRSTRSSAISTSALWSGSLPCWLTTFLLDTAWGDAEGEAVRVLWAS